MTLREALQHARDVFNTFIDVTRPGVRFRCASHEHVICWNNDGQVWGRPEFRIDDIMADDWVCSDGWTPPSSASPPPRATLTEVPIPALIRCPECHKRHIDEGEFATKPHHTHACQYCGAVWRDTLVPTVGVQFLPGFKNER